MCNVSTGVIIQSFGLLTISTTPPLPLPPQYRRIRKTKLGVKKYTQRIRIIEQKTERKAHVNWVLLELVYVSVGIDE